MCSTLGEMCKQIAFMSATVAPQCHRPPALARGWVTFESEAGFFLRSVDKECPTF